MKAQSPLERAAAAVTRFLTDPAMRDGAGFGVILAPVLLVLLVYGCHRGHP